MSQARPRDLPPEVPAGAASVWSCATVLSHTRPLSTERPAKQENTCSAVQIAQYKQIIVVMAASVSCCWLTAMTCFENIISDNSYNRGKWSEGWLWMQEQVKPNSWQSLCDLTLFWRKPGVYCAILPLLWLHFSLVPSDWASLPHLCFLSVSLINNLWQMKQKLQEEWKNDHSYMLG